MSKIKPILDACGDKDKFVSLYGDKSQQNEITNDYILNIMFVIFASLNDIHIVIGFLSLFDLDNMVCFLLFTKGLIKRLIRYRYT